MSPLEAHLSCREMRGIESRGRASEHLALPATQVPCPRVTSDRQNGKEGEIRELSRLKDDMCKYPGAGDRTTEACVCREVGSLGETQVVIRNMSLSPRGLIFILE